MIRGTASIDTNKAAAPIRSSTEVGPERGFFGGGTRRERLRGKGNLGQDEGVHPANR